MAQTCMININAVAGSEEPEAAFTPQTLNANAGDVISWCNNTGDKHWPAPVINGAVVNDGWMDAPIPGKLPDEPPPTSQQNISFAAGGVYNYACALHPNEQRSSIRVT